MFGEKLKRYRDSLGLTQEQFAKSTNISRGIIAQLESDVRPPSKASLIKLANHSGKNIEWWLGEEEHEEYKDLQALNALLEYMLDKDMFGENGEIQDREMEYIKKILEEEVRRKMSKKRKSQF